MNKYRTGNTDVFIQEQGNDTVRLLQSDKIYKLSGFQYDKGEVSSITNCSYFTSTFVIGRNQGDMYDEAPDQSNTPGYNLVIFKDNSYKIGKFDSWDHRGDDVLAGFMVGGVLVQDKKDVELISEAAKSSVSFTTKQPQTFIGYSDGKWLQIVCDGRTTENAGLTSKALRTFIRSKYPNIELLVQMDGGGSSEMIVDKKIVNQPSDGAERKMWNGFAFIKAEEEPEEPIEPSEAMKAILSFKKPDKVTSILTGITQKEKVGTHVLCLANDLNGVNGVANCYLRAPFDCVVRSVYNYDNTSLFESTGPVITPAGTFDHCWFMATHMLDDDKKDLGVAVGKVFKQGEICYREGTKGLGQGPHIHFECGTGTFDKSRNNGLPYVFSGEYYTYNGDRYKQFVPCVNGEECSINKMFYLDNLDTSNVNILKIYSWQFYTPYEKTSPVERDTTVNQVEVTANALRVRVEPNTSCESLGVAEQGYYNVLEVETKEDYTWYKIADHNWIAGVGNYVTFLPKEEDAKVKELRAKISELEDEVRTLKKENKTLEDKIVDTKAKLKQIEEGL